MGIMFLKGGLMTTVQDAGRRGYQRFGLGVSGAVDVHAFTYASILVGNTHNEAVLEVTLLGPTIEFTSPAVIAVTGGDLGAMINGAPLAMYRALQVRKGEALCTIEAMKMMNEVTSPRDGVITEILVSEGALVEYHQELFVIE